MAEDDGYTKDGTVDYCGNPANKKETGTWRACPFILGNECCERLAYYGMSTNLVLYFKNRLHQHSATASKNVSNWSGTCYITPLIGAFLADSYLGRYWTIAGFSIIYVIGMTLLTLSASVPGMKPACHGDENCRATTLESAICFLALYLIALGTGGIKPCVSSYGADQFDDTDPVEKEHKSSFFNWFYFSINIGALIASSLLVWIQDNVGWGCLDSPIRNQLFRNVFCLGRIFQGDVCFEQFNPFLQKFSTFGNCERLSWERSTKEILLGKIKVALRNYQVHEAWESFQDFRRLYGYPEVHLVNQLIVQLSYSSNHVWMRKVCDLVLQIVREKSGLLHADTLTKLALSLARLQMPSPASVILRLMLDKGCVPSMHLLSLVVFHIVKTEIGTHLSSNYLFQVCDLYNCLKDKKDHHAVTIKLDTLVFNLVLDACVKFKLSLKGLRLIELMSLTGTMADAHSIVIISQILEMNGLRDEMQELKDHIDRVSAAYACHYCQFYDSLLSLHFKFNDIDAAAKLVLDMTSTHNCNVKKEYKKHLQNPCFIAIGSPNLRTALKMRIEPELLCKDSVLKVESRQVLIFYRGGKLVLSNRALAKFISGYKRDGRTGELSKLLLSIQGELCSVAGSSLCFDVISSCIQLGWLECAHDILDDIEATGSPMGQDMYLLLVSAYQKRGMKREAKALLKQMKKVGLLDKGLSDDAMDKHNLCEKTLNSLGKTDLAIALAQILKDEEDQTVFHLVYNFNSSIFFFCKARMIEDALKAYRRMVSMKVQPTSQTFAFLMCGYSSLGMYREITILWGDIKRFMKSDNLVGDRDLYELLLLNFLQGGYFERVMEVISHMRDRNMYADKWIYKSEFLRLHKNLYRSLKASNTTTEAQSKRLEHVQEFRKWVGID